MGIIPAPPLSKQGRRTSFTGGLSDNFCSAQKGRKEDKKKCTTPYRCVSYVYNSSKPDQNHERAPTFCVTVTFCATENSLIFALFLFFCFCVFSLSSLFLVSVYYLHTYIGSTAVYQSIFLPPQNSISSCPIVKIKASSQNHTRDQQLGLVDLQGGVPVAFEAILGVYVGSGCNVYVGVSDSFEKGRKTG